MVYINTRTEDALNRHRYSVMILGQLFRELLPLVRGKPRRIIAAVAAYAIFSTYPESVVAHPFFIEHYGAIRTAGVAGLIYWALAELVALYGESSHRAVPYHEFEQFRKDQTMANEEAADMLVRLHLLLSADDDTTLADRVEALELQQRELEKRQYRMLDAIHRPYYETDATGRLTLVNEPFAELYHTTPRNMLRIGTAPYVHNDDVENVFNRFKSAITAQSGYTVQFRVYLHGKTRRCVRVTGYPMHCDEGKTFLGHYGYAEVIPCDGE